MPRPIKISSDGTGSFWANRFNNTQITITAPMSAKYPFKLLLLSYWKQSLLSVHPFSRKTETPDVFFPPLVYILHTALLKFNSINR